MHDDILEISAGHSKNTHKIKTKNKTSDLNQEHVEDLSEEVIRADNDGAWKEILRLHLQDFIAFFWQEAYEEIDWTIPYESLEQELLAIDNNQGVEKKFIDKLFKVFLKNKREQWVLLHLEPQHDKVTDFPLRMFTYYYRIYEKHKKQVASLVILADKDANWMPNKFCETLWGTEIIRTYKVVKILDYADKKEELYKSSNPFALVLLIQLAALETKHNQHTRMTSKIELFRALRNLAGMLRKQRIC